MAFPKNPIPTYRRHKASGQAFVLLPGRRQVYLGVHGSPESKAAYRKLVATLGVADGQPAAPPPVRSLAEPTVKELAVEFLLRNLDGYSASERKYYVAALRVLRDRAGDLPAAEFGPLALTAVRDAMVKNGWTREHVNAQVRRVRAVFRWAETVELVPAGKWFQLRTLPVLKAGKTTAPDQRKKRAVPDLIVDATLPHLSPTVAAMVRFQRLTGCRPQDACGLNLAEIDRAGAVWVFRPDKHKNRHRGQSRAVYIGPRAQAVIRPYLTGREDAPAVFSPRIAWQERSDSRATGAKVRRAGYAAKGPPANVGEVFDTNAYVKAIRRGCVRAGVEKWTPNMIRHAVATDIRARHGLEAAQKVLDHKRASTTELYAKLTSPVAERIAAEEG